MRATSSQTNAANGCLKMFKNKKLIFIAAIFSVFIVSINAGKILKLAKLAFDNTGLPVKSTIQTLYRSFKKDLRLTIEGQLEENVSKSVTLSIQMSTEEIIVSNTMTRALGKEPSTVKENINAVASKVSEAIKTALLVTSNVEEPQIKILNIQPKYRDGIELSNGDYEVEISKPGYRTQVEWVTIDNQGISSDQNKIKQYNLNIDLQKEGVENCEEKVDIQVQRFDNTIDSPALITTRLKFENTTVPELYRNTTKKFEKYKWSKIMSSTLRTDYAEIISEYGLVTWDEMKENVSLNESYLCKTYPEWCSDLRAISHISYERIDNDVLFVDQTIYPMMNLARLEKGLVCENLKF